MTTEAKERKTKKAVKPFSYQRGDNCDILVAGDHNQKMSNPMKASIQMIHPGQRLHFYDYQRLDQKKHQKNLTYSHEETVASFPGQTGKSSLSGAEVFTNIRIAKRKGKGKGKGKGYTYSVIDGRQTLGALMASGAYIFYVEYDLTHVSHEEAEIWEKGLFERIQNTKPISSQHSFEIVSSIPRKFINMYRKVLESFLPDSISSEQRRCQSAKLFGTFPVLQGQKIETNKQDLKRSFAEMESASEEVKAKILGTLSNLLASVTKAYEWKVNDKQITAATKNKHTDEYGDVDPEFWGKISPWNDGGYLLLALSRLFFEVANTKKGLKRFTEFLEESSEQRGRGAVAKAVAYVREDNFSRNGASSSNEVYHHLRQSWTKWNA